MIPAKQKIMYQDYPCSRAQQNLWITQQLLPPDIQQVSAYHVANYFLADRHFNSELLKKSLYALIQRHGSLRTIFININGEVQQRVIDAQSFHFNINELSVNKPSYNESLNSAKQLAKTLFNQAFHLDQGPLLRCAIINMTTSSNKMGDYCYLICFVFHHIIIDAESLAIFFQECATLYSALAAQTTPTLPSLQLHYSDFAHQQQNAAITDSLKFWQNYLADYEPFDLPYDLSPSTSLSCRGKKIHFTIPDSIFVKLKKITLSQHTTLFTGFLTLLQIVLYQYCDRNDIVIAIPYSHRTEENLATVIGLFIDTIFIRAKISDHLRFSQLLQNNKQNLLTVFENAALPYQKNINHSFLQVMFAMNYARNDTLQLDGVKTCQIDIDDNNAKFPLTLFIEIAPNNSAAACLEYNSDLFSATTANHFATTFINTLSAIVEHESVAIEHLLHPNKTDSNKLKQWSEGPIKSPANNNLNDRLDLLSRLSPTAIACRDTYTTITYQTLQQRAHQLANFLLNTIHIKPQDMIVIHLPRCCDTIIILIASLLSGIIYLPIDITLPLNRKMFILKDSQPKLIISHSSFIDFHQKLDQNLYKFLELDCAWPQINKHPNRCIPIPINSNNLVYIIYTSGSTGNPKGVQVKYSGLMNYLNWAADYYCQQQPANSLFFTSLAFDLTITALLVPLYTGGCVEILPENKNFVDHVLNQTQPLTFLKLTPSHLRLINARLKLLPHQPIANLLVIGGEELYDSDLQPWQTHIPIPRIVNEYGPTETVVGCVVYDYIQSPHSSPAHSLPIGKPINNTKIYLLNANRKLAPVGAVAELYIGGVGVAQGYLNNPLLTQQKFIVSPFDANEIIYRTGDLARWSTDGNLLYLGRIDTQIKINGFRIELAEIENKILSYADGDITQARVLALQKTLVAFIKISPTYDRSSTNLLNYLQNHLPYYMLPAAIIPVDEFPLTINGKIDNVALEKIFIAFAKHKVATLPTSHLEKTLQQIWSKILTLEINQFDIDDDFFQMGGDSIMLLQVIAQAKQENINITLSEFYSYRTISRIAKHLDTKSTDDIKKQAHTIPNQCRYSPIQHWFFARTMKNSDYYHQSCLLNINKKDIDPQGLKTCLLHLIMHHDMLHARFYNHSFSLPKPQQIDANLIDQSLQFSVVAITDFSPSQLSTVIDETTFTLQNAINIKQGPIVGAIVFIDHSHTLETKLFIIVHHLVMDGVSWRIFLADLATLYHQSMNHQSLLLGEKTTSFPSWTHRLYQFANTKTALQHLPFWLQQKFSPTDDNAWLHRLHPTNTLFENIYDHEKTQHRKLTVQQTTELMQATQSIRDTRLEEILLTAYVLSFYRLFAQPYADPSPFTCILNMESHGRANCFANMDLSSTIGWFTALFPIKIVLTTPQQLMDCLYETKTQLRAIAQDGISFGMLKYLCADSRVKQQLNDYGEPGLGFNFLGRFDNIFNKNDLFQPADDITAPTTDVHNPRAQLLDMNCSIIKGQLCSEWSYNTNLHSTSTITKLSQCFTNILSEYIHLAQSGQANCYITREYPTLAKSILVPLQTQGDNRPLFCIHPGGGSVTCYQSLAKLLGPHQPCYAISDPCLTDPGCYFASVEETAKCYILALRRQQTKGPFILAGWSFGGLIAYEMARQLHAVNESVQALFLFDTWLWPTNEFGYAPTDPLHFAQEMRLDPAIISAELLEKMYQSMRQKAHHTHQYHPDPIPYPIFLFKSMLLHAHTLFAKYPFAKNGWERIATLNMTVYPVSGDHEAIMSSPQVEMITKQLSLNIARANKFAAGRLKGESCASPP